MADKKISALTAATTPLAGTEVLPIVQSGSTVKVSIADVTAGRTVNAANLVLSGDAAIGTSITTGIKLGLRGAQTSTVIGCDNGVNTGFVVKFSPGLTNIGNDFSQPLGFLVNNIQQAKLEATGNFTNNTGNFVLGTAGKGIDFSANANAPGMTSELLNWYEEGTWTAGVSFGGASTGVTYSNNTGYYTRVGNLVTVSCYLVLSNKGSSTGTARITGLPFTCANSAAAYAALSVLPINVTFIGQLSGYANINATTIDLVQSTGINLSDTGFANNSTFIISLTYRAA